MKNLFPFALLFSFALFAACGDDTKSRLDDTQLTEWEKMKSNQTPVVVLSSEFGTPYRQPLANPGWEDGIHISRDGLDLYCVYVPGDLLSFTLKGLNPDQFGPYIRGPLFGMDLVTNPAGRSSWIHGDILYAHRNSASESFTTWTNSSISQATWSEGAPDATGKSGSTLAFFAYTSNHNFTGATARYDTDIWFIRNTSLDPSTTGASDFSTTFISPTLYEKNEDNPDLEILDSLNMVLFFDSDNYTGNVGSHDIWYMTSSDAGAHWTAPANVSTVNTTAQENQPHLYKSGSDWYLYYSAPDTNGKLAIYRCKQQTVNNWDSWGAKELVVSAGTTAGVGEPTLTANGDLSFVVVYDNGKTGSTDRYDADPWFLPKK